MPFRTKGAVYAIAFAIWSTPTNQILDLAWLLTRFQDMYIRENDYTTFNLVNISYRVCEVGTYGLLLYDDGLAAAYRNAELTSNATLHDIPPLGPRMPMPAALLRIPISAVCCHESSMPSII
ncbi:hypothetical protein C8F01DRAFT_1264871 [Mycena amicta]|nr:hypothetical protein C8F01DRAFT_1264871 [Mycena amicta]